MAESSNSVNMVRLESSDGKIFEVEEAVASQSGFLRRVIRDVGTKNPIPLTTISSQVLEKLIEYCRHHHMHVKNDYDRMRIFNDFDFYFLTALNRQTLFELTEAANFLDIKVLRDHACQVIADSMRQNYRKAKFERDI